MASLKELHTTSSKLYREGHMRELFNSHGSIGAVSVSGDSKCFDHEVSAQKIYRSYREPCFAALCPTLPLCSPNKGITIWLLWTHIVGKVMFHFGMGVLLLLD